MNVCKKALLLVAGWGWVSSGAIAVPQGPDRIKDHYEARGLDIGDVSCNLCHVRQRPIFNRTRNDFGKMVEENLNIKDPAPDFSVIDELDADGDGISNLQELLEGTAPGYPQ